MRVRRRTFCILPVAALGILVIAGTAQTPANPWASSSWQPPPPAPGGYTGPVFKLSYDYPAQPVAPPANPPWIKALGGKPISADNAIGYVQALKDYISDDMRVLTTDYSHWYDNPRKWYNVPWLFSIRDPIRGAYVGFPQDPSVFPLSNMKKKEMTDYVFVYYNDVAGYTLGQIWGKSALNPDLTKAQFQDGAIIIKAALSDATPADWSPLEGAATWELYPPVIPPPPGNPTAPTKIVTTRFFQFDIIVKDTKTAPATGWVFATLVYDKNVPGDGWTRMVPLGAMWGNDPDFNSVVTPNAPLQESVINPMAPLYAVETLGYGGRLSGPNDGAVSENNIIDGQLVPRARISSCMSCHGVAEWPLKSNLTPTVSSTANNPPDPNNPYSYVPPPGSLEFNNWFQDRPGTMPQDAGSVALDYDMNIALKALPFWQQYAKSRGERDALLSQVPKGLRELVLNPAQASKTGKTMRQPK
jgi:hypothetical protein